MRCDSQRMERLWSPLIVLDRAEQFADLLRFNDRGMVFDARDGQRAPQDIGRIALGPQRGKAIAKDTPSERPQPECGLMVPATFNALQDVEQFMRRHQSYRATGDTGEEFEKPPRLFEGGRRLSFSLHLLDVLVSDEFEDSLRREFRCDAPLALLFHRVDTINELCACLVALLARLGKRQVGKAAKRQLPLVAQHFVAETPKQRPGGLDDKE